MTRWKRLFYYLMINMLVSACTTVVVISIWDRTHNSLPGEVQSLVQSLTTSQPVTTSAIDLGTFDSTDQSPLITPTLTLTNTLPTEIGSQVKQYTVVSGDIMGTIADKFDTTVAELIKANPNITDPDRLEVGQIIIIPVATKSMVVNTPLPGETTTPTVPSATPTQGIVNPQVIIDSVIGIGDLPTEHILLKNTGSGAISLAGWQIVEEGGLVYTFPQLNLFGGGAVNLFTKAGQDTVVELYWGLTMPVWQSGEMIVLLDNQGKVRATFPVP